MRSEFWCLYVFVWLWVVFSMPRIWGFGISGEKEKERNPDFCWSSLSHVSNGNPFLPFCVTVYLFRDALLFIFVVCVLYMFKQNDGELSEDLIVIRIFNWGWCAWMWNWKYFGCFGKMGGWNFPLMHFGAGGMGTGDCNWWGLLLCGRSEVLIHLTRLYLIWYGNDRSPFFKRKCCVGI